MRGAAQSALTALLGIALIPGGPAAAQALDIVGTVAATPRLAAIGDEISDTGRIDLFSSDGPYTLLAFDSAAFLSLPARGRGGVLAAEGLVDRILRYHLLEGAYLLRDLRAEVELAGGTMDLETVQGETLTVILSGPEIVFMDAVGGTARIVQGNLEATNGIVHVIDTVLLPQ
ncbi:MAG: fasciclin domain-containing protein [Pseudomonadota bacterium]